MKRNWWKILCVVLLLYTIIGGFLMPVPAKFILNETIRNLHFHVPMWFGMITLFIISVVYSIKYLRTNNIEYDIIATESVSVGLVFGTLGLLTGMLWAKFTWGAFWSNDIKQLCAAICWLTYLAYMVLRGSFTDMDRRAKISAVYNVFAFALLIPVLFIIPRMTDSLHPGNGGNPGFNAYDLDNELRMVFYPASAGWILLGVWILNIRVRIKKLLIKQLFE